MARIFLLRFGTELDFETVNLQVRELGFSSDSEKLFLGTSGGNVSIPSVSEVYQIITEKIQDGTIPGTNGKSAHQLWVDLGNAGDESAFIASLSGTSGKTAHQTWIDLGNTGDESAFIASLGGASGKSAYQAWVDLGNTGTEQDFIDSLAGGTASQSTSSVIPTLIPGVGGDGKYLAFTIPYSGEGVIQFTMLEFNAYSSKGGGDYSWVKAPLTINGAFYISGGLTGTGIVSEMNLNSVEFGDRSVVYYLDGAGNISGYVNSLRVSPDTKAIFIIGGFIPTTTGHVNVGMNWHAA